MLYFISHFHIPPFPLHSDMLNCVADFKTDHHMAPLVNAIRAHWFRSETHPARTNWNHK
jgi:hypothetical protein